MIAPHLLGTWAISSVMHLSIYWRNLFDSLQPMRGATKGKGAGLLLTEVSTDSPPTFEQEFFWEFATRKPISTATTYFVIHNLSIAFPAIRACSNAKSHPLPDASSLNVRTI
jgi:hypothetical protein